MDKETIKSYNDNADTIAELHSTLIPYNIYQLIDKYFDKNGICVDIGCGIGRDSNWLLNNGYSVVGIDASIKMLNIAKKLYPEIEFIQDSLPLLNSIKDGIFHNVLCSAVIMHVKDVSKAVSNISRTVVNNGVIIVSVRKTTSHDNRENGKLYNNFSFDGIKFKNLDLIFSETIKDSRNFQWTNMVFRKV